MDNPDELEPLVDPHRHPSANSPSPKLLILDCDGVLVDSEPIVCRTYWHMMTDIGYSGTLDAFMTRFSGVREEGIIEAIGRELDKDPGILPGDLRAAAYDALERGLAEGSAFAEVLRQVHVDVCIASNSDERRLRLCVERSGLADLLRGRTFSADEVGRPKPAPDLFLLAARTCGAKPAECIVVEDSVSGIRAATTFGAKVVAFAHNHPGGEHANQLLKAGAARIISRPENILSLLRAGAHPQVERQA